MYTARVLAKTTCNPTGASFLMQGTPGINFCYEESITVAKKYSKRVKHDSVRQFMRAQPSSVMMTNHCEKNTVCHWKLSKTITFVFLSSFLLEI